MKSLLRTSNYLFAILTILTILPFCSCSSDKDLAFSDHNGFTQVEIGNSSGRNIILTSPSPDEGALGVKIGDERFWLSGKPRKLSESEFIWDIDRNRAVILRIDGSSANSIEMSLTLEAGELTATEWYITILSDEKEYFTGIFERVVDGSQTESWKDSITTGLNLRGEIVEMRLKPTVSAYAPFFISSDNYGLFVKSTWPGKYDFCSSVNNRVKVSFEGPQLSMSWLFGTPMEVVQQHALLTGPSIVPPEWALGPWRWRDEHFNPASYYDGTPKKAPYNTDLVEDVLMMQALDIPFTAYWIDRPWGPGIRGFDDYELDEDRLPHAEDMIAWLNSKDIALMMWIGPFVMGEMADYAEENNYYLKSNIWKDSRQVLMDFTHTEAVKWWGENGPGKLARMGIKGFKLDRADGEKLLDSLNLYTYAGTSYRENFNDYPVQYVKATYDAVKPVLGDDFILFPRAQYTGSARYGGMWSGDPNGKAEGLRSVIIGMQRCAVMGYPLWGSDIGGYWGDFSRETCMRWIAFGCFSPLMETGPTNNRGFWSNPDEPHYDVELLAVWRLYSKLRMKLVPYLAALSKEAGETGKPIACPLFLNFPDQAEAWNDWQTYTLGDDLLVSAIWEKDIRVHKLYLPAGENWINAWNTEEVFEGGNYIEVEAPLYKIPLFIRQGSQIDLDDLNKLYQESLEKVAHAPDLSKLEETEGWK